MLEASTDFTKGLISISDSVGDEDDGELRRFKYTCVNVAGDEAVSDVFEEQFQGCGCLEGECGGRPDCSCVGRWGQNYSSDGLILHSVLTSHPAKPVLECNSQCACSHSCSNRLAQRGLCFKLQVFPTGNKGWGLRTLEPIPVCSFVCEYAGEVLSYDTAKTRAQSLTPGEKNYLITLNEHCSSGLYRTYIDPVYIGNIGRFINHSCEPNLAMIPVRVDNNIPKLALFACRDISSFEELSFDYSGGSDVDQASSGTNVCDNLPKTQCKCGAKSCRGQLPFDVSLFQK